MESVLDRQVEEIVGEFSSCTIESHEKLMIETKLQLLDVHFNWDPEKAGPIGQRSGLQKKIEEMIGNSGFTFSVFCSQLVFAQELLKSDTSSGLQKIIECEQWVKSLKNDICKEKEFVSIYKALQYIVLGCKAFASFKSGFFAETKEILQNIPDCSEMDDKEISGIFGVKACSYMEYGFNGYIEASNFINIARSKYPEMAEWHFLSGRIMLRLRKWRDPTSTGSEEEEKLFQTAHELNKNNAIYALHFAQITSENAYAAYKKKFLMNEMSANININEMFTKVSSSYKNLIYTNWNDSYILSRSAFGLTKLPKKYRFVDLAVEAIERAMKVCPDSPLAFHYAGLIYSRHVKDYDKGLKYLEIAANLNNYPARMDWIKLKYQLDHGHYDPIPELIEALEYEDYSSKTCTEIAFYYLFNKNDFFQAWHYVKKVSNEDMPRHYQPFVLNMMQCNLYEVMFDEVKIKIEKQKYENEEEKETVMSIGKQLAYLCKKPINFDYSNLKSKFLKEAAQIDLSMKWKNKKDSKKNESSSGRGRNSNRGKDRLMEKCTKSDESSSQDGHNRSKKNETKTSANTRKRYGSGKNRTPSFNNNFNPRTVGKTDGFEDDRHRESTTSSFENKSKVHDWRSELRSRQESIDFDNNNSRSRTSHVKKNKKEKLTMFTHEKGTGTEKIPHELHQHSTSENNNSGSRCKTSAKTSK